MPLSARAKVDRDRWAGWAHPACGSSRRRNPRASIFTSMAAAGHGARRTSRTPGSTVWRSAADWRSCRWNIGLRPRILIPAGPDDCEAAALWVSGRRSRRFGTDRLFIGGESGRGASRGADAPAPARPAWPRALPGRQSLCRLLRSEPDAECGELGQRQADPQYARRSDVRRLFLRSRSTTGAIPTISPLYADLGGLPPALFSVGTRDLLLDDTLFMAARWASAGNPLDLAIWPGGCHVFIRFDSSFPSRHCRGSTGS